MRGPSRGYLKDQVIKTALAWAKSPNQITQNDAFEAAIAHKRNEVEVKIRGKEARKRLLMHRAPWDKTNRHNFMSKGGANERREKDQAT